MLTWQDFDVLECVYSVLDPLCQMTDLLSGEKYVTVSTVKPLLTHLLTNVLIHKEEETDLSKEIKSRIREKLIYCYTDNRVQTLLSICSFLDPRFKLRSSSIVPNENPSDSMDTITRIREEMFALSGDNESHESSEDNRLESAVQQSSKRPRKH